MEVWVEGVGMWIRDSIFWARSGACVREASARGRERVEAECRIEGMSW